MSLVGVASLGIHTMVTDDVLETLVHETSFTAHVSLCSCLHSKTCDYLSYHIVGGLIYILEQSTRFCSESETNLPVALKCCPSREPVVLNAQQEPHWP